MFERGDNILDGREWMCHKSDLGRNLDERLAVLAVGDREARRRGYVGLTVRVTDDGMVIVRAVPPDELSN